MTDAKSLPPDIQAALLRDDYFVERSASKVEVVRSSNRPVSNVYQVRVHFDSSTELFWIKTHSPESLGDAEREFRFMQEAALAFRDYEKLGVPTPIAYMPEVAAVVSEDGGGVSLADLIRQSLHRLATQRDQFDPIVEHLVRCGAWLAVLHSSKLDASQAFDPEILREYIDVRLERLEDEAAISGRFRQRAMFYLESLISRFNADDLVRVWTHADYAPYNALVRDDYFLALDPGVGTYMARLNQYSSRHDDLVHCHHFTKQMSSWKISSRIRAQLAAAFLRGYNEGVGLEISEASAGFRAFEMKYELLEVAGMAWPSALGAKMSRRLRLARFHRWFERADAKG